MWIFGRTGPSGFSASSTAEQVTLGTDGNDLTAVVTGASSGIGEETTRVLVLRGVHVIMAVRNMDTGKQVREAIINKIPNAKIDVMELDLSSMASIRKFAADYISSGFSLNLLINNAGVLVPSFTLSEDNIELQFATNHLGHFLLTNLLLERMKDTVRESKKEARIVNVSSAGYTFTYNEGICFEKINDEFTYNGTYAYGQSKLANILHTNELARHFKEEGLNITANSLHPGIIPTNVTRHNGFLAVMINIMCRCVLKNIPQGAATTCYLALNPQVKGVTGEYFSDCNISKFNLMGKDEELAKKLWDFSCKLTDPE